MKECNQERVTLIFRHREAGPSVEKVIQIAVAHLGGGFRIRRIYLPCRHADPWSVLRNLWFVFQHRDITGINHITGDVHYIALALAGCRTVLTIHDAGNCDLTVRHLRRWLFQLVWFILPLSMVRHWTSVSVFTRDRVRALTGRCDGLVIYNPVAAWYQSPVLAGHGRLLRILQVGAAENKNLLNLIIALRGLSCRLRIIASVDASLKATLQAAGIDYSERQGLSEVDMVEEYRQADVVVFCSTYEGFGMPIIEGQAMGRCVVTSDLPPMTEVGGGACLYANPYDPASIRAAIERAAEDTAETQELRRRGIQNAQRFAATSIAGQYRALYRGLDETCI